MGLFSSSKSSSADPRQGPVKSRWFSSRSSSSSSKHSINSPSAASTPKATPAARFPSLHQQYTEPEPARAATPQATARLVLSLLPPPADRDPSSRRNGEPSGSGSTHPGRSSAGPGGERAVPATSRKGKGREDDATVLLANRLNELALSNADGLLGDEEYRILRQEIFEQMSAARTQAAVEARNGLGNGGGEMVNRESLRTPTPGRHPDRPPSTHSSQSGRSRLSNLGSLFSHKKSAHDLRSNRDSLASHGAGSSIRSSRLSGGGADSSSLFSSGLSQRTSRTSHDQGGPGGRGHQSSNEGGGLSIRSGRTGYSSMYSTADGSRPGSIFSTSTRTGGSLSSAPPSAFSLRTLQTGAADGLPGANSTPAEIRSELVNVEAEGQRLLAVFEGLKAKARAGFGEHGASPKIDSPASDGGEWTMINHSPSLGSIGKMATAGAANGALKPALKKTSATALGNGHKEPQHLKGQESMSSLSSLPASLQRQGSMPVNGKSSLPERSMLPPSFRAAASTDPDQAALQTRLADIDRRRRDVQERYDRRLEFLRGKLRAAEIREKALR